MARWVANVKSTPLGILIVVAARLANVGAMRVTQTLVPLAGLGTAALLLKTSFVGIADPTSLGDLVSGAAYIFIGGGIALSGSLAERTFAPMRAQAPSRAYIALIIWLAVAGVGAGMFAANIAAAH